MPEDRSLDEFAGAGSEETENGQTAGEESEDAGENDRAVDTESENGQAADANGHADRFDPADDPATSTAAWTAAGAGCQQCGAQVSRRWRDDGDLVCAECKEW
jgi:hypothetical protein